MTIYLYVKQHAKTGLKYFGRTTSNNPFKYKGSGTYWTRHCYTHGWDEVRTTEVWGFDNQEECTYFALRFSKDNNIVESHDFANLEVEDGCNGKPLGAKVPEYSRIRYKIRSDKQIEQFVKMKSLNKGRKHTDESKAKMTGPTSEEHKQKLRKPKKLITCLVCGAIGPSNTIKRYHKH